MIPPGHCRCSELTPQPCRATRSWASWAAAAWASSTRPGRSALNRVVALKMILAGGHAGARRAGAVPRRGGGGRPAAAPEHRAGLRGRRARRAARSSRWSSVDGGSLDQQARRHAAAAARGGRAGRDAGARRCRRPTTRGVVHRDLKPANVLLDRRRHAEGHRLRPGQEARRRQGQTQTGAVMGTPTYMAPEQAERQARTSARRRTCTRWGRSSTSASPAGRRSRPRRRWTRSLQVRRRRAGAAAQLQPGGAARPGDDLPEVPAEGAGPALRQRRGAGRRPAAASSPASRSSPGRSAHRRLGAAKVVSLTLVRGQQLLAADGPASLPWFAEAVRLDPDPAHRERLGLLLQGLPRPHLSWRPVPRSTIWCFLPRLPSGRRRQRGVVRICDLESGGARAERSTADSPPVLAVAFSPDGKQLATAGGVFLVQGMIRRWDIASGKEVGKAITSGGRLHTRRFLPGRSAPVRHRLLRGRLIPRTTTRKGS